jgi:hypothetical protein
MKLYKKTKRDFIQVNDYNDIKIGSIVKVYSEKTAKFINNTPYFVSAIGKDTIVLESGVSRLNFNINSEDLSLR